MLTGVGGITPLNIARSLRLLKDEYVLVGVDCDKDAYGLHCRTLFDSTYLVPPAHSPDYIPCMQRIIDRERVEVLICSPDEEMRLLSPRRGELRVRMLWPDDSFIQATTSKAALYALLSGTKFVPSHVVVGRHGLPDALGWVRDKLWVRPARGTSAAGACVAHSIREATEWIEKNKDAEQWLVAEYLPGDNLGWTCLVYRGQVLVSVCIRRDKYFMAKVSPVGITGNISVGTIVHRPDVDSLSREVLAVLRSRLNCDISGVVTLDWKEDRDGVPRLTEINPRHIAPTFAIALAGCNLSDLHVKAALGITPSSRLVNPVDHGTRIYRTMDGLPEVVRSR